MNVIKADMQCFRVSNEGEWATICLSQGKREDVLGYPCFTGEILIRSSLGSFGNYWGSMGSPFPEFLKGIDFGYAMSKLENPEDLREYNARATFDDMLRDILQSRLCGDLDKEQARARWSAVHEIWDDMQTADDFVRACYEHPVLDKEYSEPWEFIRETVKPRYEMFWEKIWKPFVEQL